MTNHHNDWLRELAVGEVVVIGEALHPDQVETIERITSTMIVTDKHRYRMSDGYIVKSTYERLHIRKPDPERLKKAKLRLKVEYLKGFKFENLIQQALDEIIAIIQREEAWQKVGKES